MAPLISCVLSMQSPENSPFSSRIKNNIMIHTIQGDISIHLSAREDKYLTQYNGVVFNREDTLKSAVNERNDLFQTGELDKFRLLNSDEHTNLLKMARQMNGSVGCVRFDKDKCILLGDFYKLNEKISSSTISRKVSIEYCTLSKQTDQYHAACHKMGAIYKVYSTKLTHMLHRVGVRHVVGRELWLAFRCGDYCLDSAFAHATNNIYTPLKLIMSELWLNSGYVVNMKSMLKQLEKDWTKEKDKPHECQSTENEVNEAFKEKKSQIETEIIFLNERRSVVLEESKQMKMEFLSKLIDCVTEKLNEQKVMRALKSKNWNMNTTFEHVTTHLNKFV